MPINTETSHVIHGITIASLWVLSSPLWWNLVTLTKPKRKCPVTSAKSAFCDAYYRLEIRVNSLLNPIAVIGPLQERQRYILGNQKSLLVIFTYLNTPSLYSPVSNSKNQDSLNKYLTCCTVFILLKLYVHIGQIKGTWSCLIVSY